MIQAQADNNESIYLKDASNAITEEIIGYTKGFIESDYPSLIGDSRDINKLMISEGHLVYDLDVDQTLTTNKTRLSTMVYDSDTSYYIFYTLLNNEAGIYLQVDNSNGSFKVTSIGGLAKNFQVAEQIMKSICENENEDLNYKVYALNFYLNDYLMVYEKNGQEYVIPFNSNTLDSSYLEVSDYRQLPTANVIIEELKQKTIELQQNITEVCGDEECYGGGGVVLTTQAIPLSMINKSIPVDHTALYLVTVFIAILLITASYYIFKHKNSKQN